MPSAWLVNSAQGYFPKVRGDADDALCGAAADSQVQVLPRIEQRAVGLIEKPTLSLLHKQHD
jgi:hypothetical protein